MTANETHPRLIHWTGRVHTQGTAITHIQREGVEPYALAGGGGAALVKRSLALVEGDILTLQQVQVMENYARVCVGEPTRAVVWRLGGWQSHAADLVAVELRWLAG